MNASKEAASIHDSLAISNDPETTETDHNVSPDLTPSVHPDVNLDLVDPNSGTATSNNAPVENPLIQEAYNFHEYKNLTTFLQRHVTGSGTVNYNGIKGDLSAFNAIIKEFESNVPNRDWSSDERLVFWINAYNIYTLKLVTDNYPISSITKIAAKPWDKKFIQLGGSTYSLNNIEHTIIRKKFNEPRIHFALNCASISCPILMNEAFTPKNIDSQLTQQTKKFLNDTSKNKLWSDSIQISELFDWYEEDFTKNGTLIDFINKYRDTKLSNPTISYIAYSWDLND
ncbi:MAG: DUF547 domain-containing protein [Crocinitomicaceae bacterium]|nr:DUF547 domain-containing protein [Crocinitomicaceae bacterium]